jgi:hypothetical protein
MGLYNMVHGVNQCTFFILPMLGEKHTDEYPRFRDCAIDLDGEHPEIHVLTRVGGPNRGQGFGEEELMQHPNFLRTFDAKEDRTYGYYVFSVPDKFRKDFDILTSGPLNKTVKSTSDTYKQRICKTFPKLETKFKSLF